MRYPEFFNEVKKITLYDPLAEMLGTFEKGIITFSYVDVVKSAGHSCPTVAGAYLMSLYGLKALYKDGYPVRGEIKLSFKESKEQGVVGVVANVLSNITGASDEGGFKGLNKKFSRNNLINFQTDINSNVRFINIKTDEFVDVFYDPSVVPPDQKLQTLMQKVMKNLASDNEKKEFGTLWQKRVKEILVNSDKYPNLLRIETFR